MYNPRESDTGSKTSTDDAYDLACDVGSNALTDNNNLSFGMTNL